MTGETNAEITPAFPVKERRCLEVHELELSAFVSQHYGRPWSMQQGELLDQDTYRDENVRADRPDNFTAEEAEELLKQWLAVPTPADDAWILRADFRRNQYLPVGIILWDLCRKGVITPGDYLIKVWW